MKILIASLMSMSFIAGAVQADPVLTSTTSGNGKSWTVSTDGSLRMRSIKVTSAETGSGNAWLIVYLSSAKALPTPWLILGADGTWNMYDSQSIGLTTSALPAPTPTLKNVDLSAPQMLLDMTKDGVKAKAELKMSFVTNATDSNNKTVTSPLQSGYIGNHLLRVLSLVDPNAQIFVGVGSDWKSMLTNKTFAAVGSLAATTGMVPATMPTFQVSRSDYVYPASFSYGSDDWEISQEKIVAKAIEEKTYTWDKTASKVGPFISGPAPSLYGQFLLVLDGKNNIHSKYSPPDGSLPTYRPAILGCVLDLSQSPAVTCKSNSILPASIVSGEHQP